MSELLAITRDLMARISYAAQLIDRNHNDKNNITVRSNTRILLSTTEQAAIHCTMLPHRGQ